MKRVVHTVPVGDILVGNTGGDIEHDDTTLSVDVVTITETTKLLLTGSVPDIELDLTVVLSPKVSLARSRRGSVGRKNLR